MNVEICLEQYGLDDQASLSEGRELAVERARSAAQSGADLVVLPELAASPYFPATAQSENDLPDDLDTLPGDVTGTLQDVAENNSSVIVYPTLESASEGIFSSAAVIDSTGEFAGVYRRIHSDGSGEVDESWLALGDQMPVFPTEIGNIGVMIGHDRHFPEQSRILGVRGADILCVPSAGFGDHDETWELELRAHTVAHGVFLAAANRTGSNGDLDFFGDSLILDPRAQFVAQASDGDDRVTGTCDLDEIREVRDLWQFFRDRRPETYDEMIKEPATQPAT